MGFLKKLVGFENSFSKNFTKDIFDKPSRLLTGIDPASTKVWNKVLGRDDQPLVNVYGSPGQQYYDKAQADGIDTGPAQAFHSVADKVAGYYGMQGISGIGGGAAGATSGSGGSGMGLMDMFSSGSGGSGGSSGLGSLLGGVIGAVGSYKSAKDQAAAMSQQGQLDPRIANLIFGENGQGGLIKQYQQLGQQPRSEAANAFAGQNADYLKNFGDADLGAIRGAAMQAMGGNAAPTSSAAQVGPAQASLSAYASGNMVNAPSQNNINLTPTYQSMLAGGDTSKLMDSLQAGNALAGAQFRQNQADLTDNLQRNVLPGIRSNAVLAGQYGGSRQGVAEGLAMSDMTKQLNNSNTQFGLGATAANSSALANNYENGQNRALAAAQGLGAQQYATAFKNADTKNAAEFMNVGNVADFAKYNAGLAQQANQSNADRAQNSMQFNAGLQQTNNAQNNQALLGGAGLLSGLLGQVGANVNANDNWQLDRAGQVNSMLASLINGTPRQNPVSANSGAAALGGGLAGLSLGNSLAGLFGNQSGITPYTGGNQTYSAGLPTGWQPDKLPVQSFGTFNFGS